MKKYILISGGELFNKGAQSMTFIAISEMKQRYPNHEVILISGQDYKRSLEDKNQYNFRILDDIFKYHFAGGLYANLKKIDKKKRDESIEILKNSDLLLDISGYALGSDWNLNATLLYLSKIKTAHKYGMEIYLMPQSFGPFDYKHGIRPIINYRIKNVLQIPKRIYARELVGFNLLNKKFNLNNVQLSADLVLKSNDVDPDYIYTTLPKSKAEEIKSNSVAIIPNKKTFQHGDTEQLIKVYKEIINKLLKLNKTIYILRHSHDDIEACEKLKNLFPSNENVILLGKDYSCLEYEEMIKDFEFIIASRYHSIVHAYREGTPSIALGWAVKYQELLKMFKQDEYIFDVRGNIDVKLLLESINKLNNNHKNEAKVINDVYNELRKENIFSDILIEGV